MSEVPLYTGDPGSGGYTPNLQIYTLHPQSSTLGPRLTTLNPQPSTLDPNPNHALRAPCLTEVVHVENAPPSRNITGPWA